MNACTVHITIKSIEYSSFRLSLELTLIRVNQSQLQSGMVSGKLNGAFHQLING